EELVQARHALVSAREPEAQREHLGERVEVPRTDSKPRGSALEKWRNAMRQRRSQHRLSAAARAHQRQARRRGFLDGFRERGQFGRASFEAAWRGREIDGRHGWGEGTPNELSRPRRARDRCSGFARRTPVPVINLESDSRETEGLPGHLARSLARARCTNVQTHSLVAEADARSASRLADFAFVIAMSSRAVFMRFRGICRNPHCAPSAKKSDPNCVLVSLYRVEPSSRRWRRRERFVGVSRHCPRARHHPEVFFFDNNASRKSDRICATRTPTPGVVETIQSQRGSAAK